MACAVRELKPADVPACARILAGLPDWFGLEASNRAYVESLSRLPGAVAESDGRIVGFAAIELHNPVSAEIHVMGVERDKHRQGIGRELVRWTRQVGRARGAKWLHVKTRGPSTPDPEYERTRAFYLAQGFEPLFESRTLWGEENAALILVASLAPAAEVLAWRESVVRRHMESENEHDFDATIETFSHPRYELIATDQVHDGEAAVREYFRASRAAFPDQRNELISLRHSDDAVLVELWLLGTHTGRLGALEPSGRAFRTRMMAYFIFDEHGIVCERVYFDSGSILRQIAV
ncbi:MAG: GNAT family N-acetyltransferase [Myxococcota bacterium]